MKMSLDEVKDKVLEVFFKIKPYSDLLVEENFEKPLTGSDMNFNERDLVYLLLELMEKFEIRFEKEDVMDYKFNTVNDIIKIVYNKISDMS